ncbi:uncharacterized protein LAESUDRAFT_677413 [Laetiporus sulphureus 93-53]|uniref:GATA-type domain-containing protein n=1 Tax=Laetiporus sulphureus 93-53 TaxID=1314785 RepID=A0A165ERP5_9APHY|nr:uncharacterized protein LAESUDRAFT_677413 [Laetiporus sulphureus 93-53]KZT07627.1 hypothetical protein LAESUDRAFT_677413 [Laetiporus sulphureus 93-53]
MNFVASSQRAFEPHPHSELTQLPPIHAPDSRIAMHHATTFDDVPILPPLASPSSVASNAPPSSAQTVDRASAPPSNMPQTRCYWSLLTPDLHFLYLDPVLTDHLHEQADELLGKSLLEFVHPDEQASAKLDLGSVLESRTLHGSVTRVRYSRLSRIREQLGYKGSMEDCRVIDKVSVDDNYMAVDIVINWASDGLVLCFIHAAVDMTDRDNDEHDKTGWSNWCGTPLMSMDQVQLLYQRLLSAVPQPLSMSRVFQILLNQPERSLWMSWPPEQQDHGGPTSKDFARLAQDVKISDAVSSVDAKTSCTRRYKAQQIMHFGVDNSKEVESIFIPHGSIIFACHKVHASTRPLNPNNAATASGHHYPSQGAQPYYDQGHHSYSLPPVPAPSSHYNGFAVPPHHVPSHYPPSNWSHPPGSPNSAHYNWNSHNGSLASVPSVSSVRSSSYSATPQQHQWPSQPPSYLDTNSATAQFPGSAPPSGSPYPPPAAVNEDTPPSPGSDYVPPSRVVHRRGSNNTRDQYGSGGRSAGNPPVGISRCSSCKVTHSPEWRKGPSGKKDLCNACGLRYARSRAKKEGAPAAQQTRRRKDRVFSAIQKDHSPSGSPVPAGYSNARHGGYYDDGSFATSSSNGSPAASEMYAPHAPPPQGHHGFHNGMSPSPSPPNGAVPYIPYAHHSHHHQNAHADGRQHYGGQPQGMPFYAGPPPPPPSAHPAGTHVHGHPTGTPHMEQGAVYSTAHADSPVSPVAESPASAGLSTSSFERERRTRDHDRNDSQPSPGSADAHHASNRSSYGQE